MSKTKHSHLTPIWLRHRVLAESLQRGSAPSQWSQCLQGGTGCWGGGVDDVGWEYAAAVPGILGKFLDWRWIVCKGGVRGWYEDDYGSNRLDGFADYQILGPGVCKSGVDNRRALESSACVDPWWPLGAPAFEIVWLGVVGWNSCQSFGGTK